MHTDYTLAILDSETKSIGQQFDKFVDKTCAAFKTQELRGETEARQRRQTGKAVTGAPRDGSASHGSILPKTFNRRTYKYHSLDNYTKMIRRLGTSESFSTEPVRLRKQSCTFNY